MEALNCLFPLTIGEGQFGKVYSAVNLDTGELMAVKQVHIGEIECSKYICCA